MKNLKRLSLFALCALGFFTVSGMGQKKSDISIEDFEGGESIESNEDQLNKFLSGPIIAQLLSPEKLQEFKKEIQKMSLIEFIEKFNSIITAAAEKVKKTWKIDNLGFDIIQGRTAYFFWPLNVSEFRPALWKYEALKYAPSYFGLLTPKQLAEYLYLKFSQANRNIVYPNIVTASQSEIIKTKKSLLKNYEELWQRFIEALDKLINDAKTKSSAEFTGKKEAQYGIL